MVGVVGVVGVAVWFGCLVWLFGGLVALVALVGLVALLEGFGWMGWFALVVIGVWFTGDRRENHMSPHRIRISQMCVCGCAFWSLGCDGQNRVSSKWLALLNGNMA